MGVKREALITNNEIVISDRIMEKFDIAIDRRIKREPVAYITGKKEFWDQDFIINHSTLIPRPETELLIYKVVDFFKNKQSWKSFLLIFIRYLWKYYFKSSKSFLLYYLSRIKLIKKDF